MSIGLHGSPCNAIVEERSQEQGSAGALGKKECILIKLHSALRKFVSQFRTQVNTAVAPYQKVSDEPLV